HDREAGDMALRRLFRNAPASLPDHQDDLALVVELLRFGRAEQFLAVADKRAREAREEARVLRLVGPVLVLRVAIAVVHAYAKNLLGVRNRQQEADAGKCAVWRSLRHDLRCALE